MMTGTRSSTESLGLTSSASSGSSARVWNWNAHHRMGRFSAHASIGIVQRHQQRTRTLASRQCGIIWMTADRRCSASGSVRVNSQASTSGSSLGLSQVDAKWYTLVCSNAGGWLDWSMQASSPSLVSSRMLVQAESRGHC
jgi:hypothetical protein